MFERSVRTPTRSRRKTRSTPPAAKSSSGASSSSPHAKRQDRTRSAHRLVRAGMGRLRAPVFPYDEASAPRPRRRRRPRRRHGRQLAEKKGSDLMSVGQRPTRGEEARWGRPMVAARRSTPFTMSRAHSAAAAPSRPAENCWIARASTASPGFVTAMTAVLEVLPVSSTFTQGQGRDRRGGRGGERLRRARHLRRLMFSDRVPEPEQLNIWRRMPLEPPA